MKGKKAEPLPEVEMPDAGELPEGWRYATILDACEVNPPKPSKDFLPADAPVTFVPMPAVDADIGAITNPQIKPYLEVRNGFTFFRDGDVIMAKITPCMENGKAAIIHGMKNGIGFGSTEFHVMRSRGEILPEFLYYYIRQESFRNEAESHFTGSVGQKRVPADFIKQSVIPLPPLAEQRRIVARIEALLSHINATRDRLSRVPLIMKKFRQGVLAAACSGRLTEEWRDDNPNVESGIQLIERIAGRDSHSIVPYDDDPPLPLPEIPDTWEWSRCFPLCDPKRDITYGVIKLGASIKGGIPTLRSSDVRWLYIDNNDVKTIDPSIASQYSRTFLKGGEIVITVRGTLGGIAVVPQSMAGYNISREVAVLPIRSDLDAKYFCYAIASIWSQNWLSEVTKGVAYTGFNIRDLKRLPLPLPPLAEQHEIIRRVGLLFERADAFDQEVVAAGLRCEQLTQAVLGKAFRGELVRKMESSNEIK